MVGSSRKKDGRREVGATVQVKATAVTSHAECKRLYGTLWKSQTVTGVVKRVVTPPAGSGKQVSIVAEWSFGDTTKVKEVKLINVKLVAEVSDNPIRSQIGDSVSCVQNVTSNLTSGNGSSTFPSIDAAVERTAVRGAQTPASAVFVSSHAVDWSAKDINSPLNGPMPRRHWSVSSVTGQKISENQGIHSLSPFDYFQWMFPMSHLSTIVMLTNRELSRFDKQPTNVSEVLKFIGVLVLMSRYEFGPRRNLWATSSSYKYLPAPNFTRIMPSHRFETLRCCIRFSASADIGESDDSNRWSLVDDFVKAINDHREMYVTPSDLICVDESMSRWYGLGGDWIDVGLPTYRAIDRKPENGCEIKSSACGRSGIMLRLEIVKSPQEDAQNDQDAGMSHGTAVTSRLIAPWTHSNRIVCGDSYFASLETALTLFSLGMKFIGVVKTAHRGFPLNHLSTIPMSGRGSWTSMVHRDNESGIDVGAVLWVDRERRYFVATSGTTLPGTTIYRERWRRVGNESRRIMTETSVPDVAETYYTAASQIDRHNRCRQDDLKLEKKFRVKEWSQRVNTSLLAMCIVDAWLLYKGNRGSRGSISPNEFYSLLAEELIDNNYCIPGTRSRTYRPEHSDVTASGIGPHLTPTIRKRKRQDGTVLNALLQGKCRSCKSGKKTKYVCSECTRLGSVDYWICHSATGRSCFTEHLKTHHHAD